MVTLGVTWRWGRGRRVRTSCAGSSSTVIGSRIQQMWCIQLEWLCRGNDRMEGEGDRGGGGEMVWESIIMAWYIILPVYHQPSSSTVTISCHHQWITNCCKEHVYLSCHLSVHHDSPNQSCPFYRKLIFKFCSVTTTNTVMPNMVGRRNEVTIKFCGWRQCSPY